LDPRWLDWARRLQAIAQNGLTFSSDPFDSERYEATRAIAADAIPPLSTGRVTAAQIARMFEHRRHPGWPTDFD